MPAHSRVDFSIQVIPAAGRNVCGWRRTFCYRIDSSGTLVPRSRLRLQNYAWDIEVDGNLAYLATGAAGLEIVDIGDADHPILSGFYDAPGIASSVSVEDGRDYLAEGDVQILDTNLPGQPKLLGSIPTQPGSGVIRRWAADVQMIRFIAYIIYGVRDEDHLSTSLSLVDISDPAHPFVISSIDANAVLKVRVVNDFAYLSASYLTSSIIDVHDPVHPVRVSELGCRFRDISLQSCLR